MTILGNAVLFTSGYDFEVSYKNMSESSTSPHNSSCSNESANGLSAKIIDIEQQHLNAMYARLDHIRSRTQRHLLENRLNYNPDDPQGISERDSYDHLYSQDINKYNQAEHSLYFGQLITEDDTLRIGKIGILDEDTDMTTLLLDWRAPLARPFYIATAVNPHGVHTRRHIRTKNRIITQYHDELLSINDNDDVSQLSVGHNITGENALIHALSQARTGHMQDIVSTIQIEQDSIIRSDHRGILVVQGGPGTGKTAVALHRAAYLLYNNRTLLEKSGVLIIGPNTTFLHYVSQVLPSLGETATHLTTMGNFYPGISATLTDTSAARTIKGSSYMPQVMKSLVQYWQRVPVRTITIVSDDVTLHITPALITKARNKARQAKITHNKAQKIFLSTALAALVQEYMNTVGRDIYTGHNLLDARDAQEIRVQLENDEKLRTQLTRFWPILHPAQVLSDFYTNVVPANSPLKFTKYLYEKYPNVDWNILTRKQGLFFSPADVPLIDELSQLIYDVDEDHDDAEKLQWEQHLKQAQEALDILAGSSPQDLEDELDPEILMAYDLLDAEELANRWKKTDYSTIAHKAQKERNWVYGHAIIDEAQELSFMDWRMIFRRIPNKWMTVVGDTAQTSYPSGTTNWEKTFNPIVEQRWQLHTLTVNYRTPREIAELGNFILSSIDSQAHIPQAIRSVPSEPFFIQQEKNSIVDYVRTIIDDHKNKPGLLAIITADNCQVRHQLSPHDSAHVYTLSSVKGLEFDHVVIFEPHQIVSSSLMAERDLYVAVSRATQTLSILYSERLPSVLSRWLEHKNICPTTRP